MVTEEGEQRGGLLTTPSSSPPIPDSTAVEPRRSGTRATIITIAFLLVASTITVSMPLLWGEVDPLSWYFLGAGAGCGIVAMLGWSLLARVTAKRRTHYGILPWLAFPATLSGSISMVPLLLLAVYPGAREWLDPQVRIDAHIHAGRLEIIFPRPTRGDALNLIFDGVSIPPGHFTKSPEDAEWADLHSGGDNRILTVNLTRLQEVFDLQNARRIGINAILDSKQIHYQTGERIPQQWVPIPD